MPIYEYRCNECGFQKEFLQRISDAPLTDCPQCGKRSLSKLVSAAGFQLKGSGWYVTDFRDKGGAKAAPKADQPAEAAKPADAAPKASPQPAPAAPAPAKSASEKA